MGRVFACSDLHGVYAIYEKIVAFLQPDDIVYCLGDCGDRGPEGWKLIKAVYNNPQFIYIKGNHEDMLVEAMRENLQDISPFNSDAWYQLNYNGGRETFKGWLKENKVDGEEWMTRLDNLPYQFDYLTKNKRVLWHLSHAGFTPFGNYPPLEEDLIWDRYHINDEVIAPSDATIKEICLHGHTPIFAIKEDLPIEPSALMYADGHKICIDNYTYHTNFAILLDLDSLYVHQFYAYKED